MPPPWRTEEAVQRGRRQAAWLWAGLVVVLVVVSPFGALLTSGLGACPFKSLTGLPCPGCGSTRAALALADFRFLEALTTYPLPTVAWMLFVCGGVVAGLWAGSGRPLPPFPTRLPLVARGMILGAVVAYWLFAIHTGI